MGSIGAILHHMAYCTGYPAALQQVYRWGSVRGSGAASSYKLPEDEVPSLRFFGVKGTAPTRNDEGGGPLSMNGRYALACSELPCIADSLGSSMRPDPTCSISKLALHTFGDSASGYDSGSVRAGSLTTPANRGLPCRRPSCRPSRHASSRQPWQAEIRFQH